MTSKVTYIGGFRCESEHLQSGNKVTTDAPTDNHGKGEAFSPTDLCATSLGQCILTTIGILGESRGVNIEGATCEIQKIMNPKPRKIAEIVCDLHFPQAHNDHERKFIEATAHSCPVYLSLNPDIKKTITFHYA